MNFISLELIEFQLAQPDINGQCTTDAFIVKSPVGEQLPIICGQNNRQHCKKILSYNNSKSEESIVLFI